MMAVVKQDTASSPSLESVGIVTTIASNMNGSSAPSITPATMQDHLQQQQQVNTGGNCCASCRMPIKDRFIFSVIEQNFHQDCVRCVDCLSNLNDRCYTFEGKLYCRLDYWRRFGPKCSACQESIKPTELVQRLKENLVYHLSCFVCQDCKRHLQAGEQLHLIDERRLLCKRDFMITNVDLKPSTANATTDSARIGGLDPQSAGEPATRISNLQQQQQHQQQQDENSHLHHIGRSHHQHHSHHLMPASDINCAASDDGLDGDDSALLDDDQQSSNGADGDQSMQSNLNDGSYGGQYVSGSKGGSGQLKNQDSGQKLAAGDERESNGQRRGPRTTIKPDQLDTLKRAFAQTPKPSRHVREQLANETHLNMRVIQVWFQNRRSKERRMKNSNGCPRRAIFRSSSSRRIRIGSGVGAGTPTAGGPLAQQSLMAGGGGGADRRTAVGGTQQQSNATKQENSPMDSKDQLQLLSGGQQQAGNNNSTGSSNNNRQSHNSPSEFGGSSSGGFTYFSDSSNQGDAFAINTGATSGQPQQKYLPTNASASGQDQQQTTLMTLESPLTSSSNNEQRQQQYQSMKNEPNPPQAQQPNYPASQQHMIHSSGATSQRGPQQQQSLHHLNAGQLQPEPSLGMNTGLLSHPSQGAPVVQW